MSCLVGSACGRMLRRLFDSHMIAYVSVGFAGSKVKNTRCLLVLCQEDIKSHSFYLIDLKKNSKGKA